MDWSGWRRYSLIGAALVVGIGLFVVAYGWLPWLVDGSRLRRLSAKDQAGILGNDRGDVLKIVAGAGAVVALLYTARKHNLDRRVHALSEQGQVTDRYTKAITQLASDKMSERIGGIYALERIMADSARDHPIVVEVLAAFVRQRAPLPSALKGAGDSGNGEGGSPSALPERPDADVQAAMTVLARRPERDEPFALDLRRTHLAGLELPSGARLAQANFWRADLSRASLYKADLTEANLGQAMLTGSLLYSAKLTRARLLDGTLDGAVLLDATLTKAQLDGAKLAEALLAGADLTEASLRGVKLVGANLMSANLNCAVLVGADLDGATLAAAALVSANLDGAILTGQKTLSVRVEEGVRVPLNVPMSLAASQLAGALLTRSTKLDAYLAHDAWVLARIEACRSWTERDAVPAFTPDPSESQRASGD